jgi:hypothetical protein
MGLLENCSGGRLFSDKNALYIIPELTGWVCLERDEQSCPGRSRCPDGCPLPDKSELSIIPQNLQDGFVREGMNRVVREGAGVWTVALTRTKVSYI